MITLFYRHNKLREIKMRRIINSKIILNKGLKPINPLICGKEECIQAHSFGPATREYWILHFVVSGKGRFKTKSGNYNVGSGDVFVIRPYEVTYYEADELDPWTYVWIGFEADMPLPGILMSNDVIQARFLRELFISAVDNDYFNDGDTNGAYEQYLCGLIWQMIGMLTNRTTQSGIGSNYVEKAISIIRSEYQNDITVSSIANRLHINRSYFCEIFKRVTGVSPKKYIHALRMRRAARLLIMRSLSVTVTASSVGFPDVFAFSRAFKSYYGVSPTEYVEKYKL